MYKNRTITAVSLTPSWAWGGNRVGGKPAITWTPRFATLGVETRGGDSVPGHRKLIAAKRSATSNRSVCYHNWSATSGFWLSAAPVKYSDGKTGYAVGSSTLQADPTAVTLPPDASIAEVAKVESYAAQKFLESVEGRVVEFGGPLFLAELKETLEFLYKPIPKMAELIKRFYRRLERYVRRQSTRRRGRRRFRWNSGKYLRFLEDTWLSFKLAIMPLHDDVVSAAEAVAKYNEVVKLGVAASSANITFNDTGFQNLLGGSRYSTRMTNVSCYIKGEIAASAVHHPSTVERAQQIAGLDFRGAIENFVPTLWNALPLTFLFDYFSNIGSVISANLSVLPKLAWTSCSTVIRRRRFMTLIPIQPSISYGSTVQRAPTEHYKENGFAYHEEKRIVRRANFVPEVQFYLEEPSIVQLITVGAITKQASRLASALQTAYHNRGQATN